MLFTSQKETQLSQNQSRVLHNSLHLINKRLKCCFSSLRIKPNLEVVIFLSVYLIVIHTLHT